MKNLFIFSLVTLLFSCTDSKEENTPSSPPPIVDRVKEPDTGTMLAMINGKPWQFVAGRAIKLFSSDTKYTIELFDFVPDDICSPILGARRSIIYKTDLKEGKQELSEKNMANIYALDEGISHNYLITLGQFIIEEVYEDEISGRAIGYQNDENKFDGAFIITVCE